MCNLLDLHAVRATWPVRYRYSGMKGEQEVEGRDCDESESPTSPLIRGSWRWSWSIGEKLTVFLVVAIHIGYFHIEGKSHIDRVCGIIATKLDVWK